MSGADQAAGAVVRPIILGGDAGAYSLARAFHQAYGWRPTVLASVATWNLRHSRILDVVIEPELEDPEVMVRRVRELAGRGRGRALVVTCVDWFVRALSEHAAELSDVATVPYPSPDLLDRVMDKARFSALCVELGVPHPRTVVHTAGAELGELGLTFPVIAKPGDNVAYHRVTFAGKAKVMEVADRATLERRMRDAAAAGYLGTFILQELIPGPDDQMRIMTTYSAPDGSVPLAHGGHVLLEEHTPGTLGNPAALLTGPLPQVEEHARLLVRHLGWRGFANFDVKIDPRDGQGYFFELNPRLGRSNFYLTAAGLDPVRYYVAECTGGPVPVPAEPRRVLYRMVPRRLVLRYLSDPGLRRAARSAPSAFPLAYRAERDPRRWAWVAWALVKQYRNFARYHPAPSRRG